jgi:steroid delta-isomerase-like uncharacterized protein
MQEEEFTIPQMVEEVHVGKMPRRNFIKRLATMGLSAGGIAAIIAAISHPSTKQSAPGVKLNEDAAKHIQLHNQHLAHQTRGNVNALHNDYADNAVVEDSMYTEPHVGRAAITARKNVIMAAASDSKITMTNRVVHGNQVSVEWFATGRHTGDLPGLPASGRSFSIRGVTVVIRHEGKIVRESLYYDVAELRRQLGPG